MRMMILVGVLLSLGFSAGAAEFAGVEGAVSGGGGKGIVCRDGAGGVKSVELLDLWEAKTLYQEPQVPLSGKLDQDVDALLVALKDAYPFSGSGTFGDSPNMFKDQDYVLAALRESAQNFLKPHAPRVHRLRGSRLELTNDSMEIAVPRDCEMGQVVNYQPNGFIFVDQDLFEKMDERNQAALIIHEAFYDFLRTSAGERNSIRVRRSVGLAMSGYRFSLGNYFTAPENALACRSKDGPSFGSTVIYLTQRASDSEFTWIDMTPFALYGSALIDVNPLVVGSFGFSKKQVSEIFAGHCTEEFHATGGSTVTGRVEFDRSLSVEWDCQNGKVTVFLSETAPGESEPTKPLELDCWTPLK